MVVCWYRCPRCKPSRSMATERSCTTEHDHSYDRRYLHSDTKRNLCHGPCAFAEEIVNTVREPLVVLDQDLRVIAASRSFYRTFKVTQKDTEGRLLYELGDGAWDIPKLRLLLGRILPTDGAIEAGAIEAYEIEHDFPGIGRRTMCLNARKVFYEKGSRGKILLGMEDITERLKFCLLYT